eukprot:1847319-Pyramimonas_sp.AAC.1
MTVFPVRVLGAGGRVNEEVITRLATTRVEVAAHEHASPSGPVKLRRGLVELQVETFPEDTSTKGSNVSFERFSEVNFV